MAIGTTAAILGGLSAAGGIGKAISGASNSRRARNAIENFRMQDLDNPYEDLSVSTLSSDLQREESARATATQIDALQQTGARGVLGGTQYLQRENNRLNQQIGADLDRQRTQIDRAIAQDDARIRGIREQRDLSTLSGLGTQMNVGRQDMWSGLGDVSQAFMFGANNLESGRSNTQY